MLLKPMFQQQFKHEKVNRKNVEDVFLANEVPLAQDEMEFLMMFLCGHSNSLKDLNYDMIFKEFGQ